MTKIVECIPNFSEGRNASVLQALVDTASEVPGAQLLDWSADASHNRSVLTLAGRPEAIAEAAFRLCQRAAGLIDLRQHQGAHPRMGATDVIPFVPVRETSMAECVALAQQVAERIARELAIPVFLYEAAASSPMRQDLATVRAGQFEGLPDKLKDPAWAPDFGPRAPHPSAGATAVGARPPLIALNINLDTDRLEVAQSIARAVRSSSGGYPHCKAIGLRLPDQGQVQVSMNLTGYQKMPIYRVFEAVRFEAARWGARIVNSEIVGLAPAQALVESAAYFLQLEGFDYHTQVLEQRLDQPSDISNEEKPC